MFNFFKKHIYFARRRDDVSVPKRNHATDAGIDLFIANTVTLRPHQTVTIGLKLSVCVPKGSVGYILARSSISKKGIHVCTGVIDAGYTGELMISLINLTSRPAVLYTGDRVAQMVVQKCDTSEVKVIPIFDLQHKGLSISDRGEKGYGSSGA